MAAILKIKSPSPSALLSRLHRPSFSVSISTTHSTLDSDADDPTTTDTSGELSVAETNLINQLQSLIKSHHHHSDPSPPPHDLTIPSLSVGFSALSANDLSHCAAASLLHRLRSSRLSLPFPQSLSFFNWWLSNSNSSSPSDLSVPFAAIIDFAGKLRYFDLSWRLLDRMHELEIPITLRVFSSLIRRYARAGHTAAAAAAFRRMRDYGLTPDNTALSSIISALSRKRASAEAQSLFDSLRHELTPDVVVFSALVHAWCRAGRIDEAERVFREMLEIGVAPNVYTYTSIIDAMCRAGQLPRGHELFCQMLDSGCPPNTAMFNAFMRAHVKAGRTEQVLQVHNQMKQFGCEPDIITYNFIIDTHCRKGQQNLDAAVKMLNLMVAKGISPNSSSFNPIFKCVLTLNDMNAAQKLYDRMRELNVKLNTVSYNLLMELFSNAKSMDMVFKMKREMEKEGVEPNVNTYRVLITACCGRGNWKGAYLLMKEVVENGLKPSNLVYEKVLCLLRNAGQLKKHDELAEKMAGRGFLEQHS